jgi:hypothetical protein
MLPYYLIVTKDCKQLKFRQKYKQFLFIEIGKDSGIAIPEKAIHKKPQPLLYARI